MFHFWFWILYQNYILKILDQKWILDQNYILEILDQKCILDQFESKLYLESEMDFVSIWI